MQSFVGWSRGSGRQGPVLAPSVKYSRDINLDSEIAAIDAAIPSTYVEVVAGAGCSGRLQTAIDTTLANGGHVHIVGDSGNYDALFDSDVSIHGKIKITAKEGITLKPSGTFSYDGIFFDNDNRGGTWATSATAPFGSELDSNQPQDGNYGWYYDSDIILDNLVVDCDKSAARVTRFVAANRIVYRKCQFTDSGQAIIADQGISGRYIINCDISDSGRGESTHEPYLGSVNYSLPPRVCGKSHWLYNTFTNCGDDAIGCVFTGRIAEEGADSDCWYSLTNWHSGYHPICTIIGNIISGTTQANGIKITFVPGMSMDVIVEGNTIDDTSFCAVQIRNASSINDTSCMPYPHVPDGNIRVDIKDNNFSDWGTAWNDGVKYWIDTGSGYSEYQATTCSSERALDRGAGFYSAVFVRSPYGLAGDVSFSGNSFTSGVGPALYNSTGRIKQDSDNEFNGFVHVPQECGIEDGTIPEIADILVSANHIKGAEDKAWTLSYTYTPAVLTLRQSSQTENYKVTVYPVGAVVDSVDGAVYTVEPGHSFWVGDKVLRNPGVDDDYSGTDTVQSTTATTITMGSSVTGSADDLLVNMGADTGTVSPNFDGSTMRIYSDIRGISSIANSEITCGAGGTFEYYHKGGGDAWELVRTDADVIVSVVDGHASNGTNYYLPDFGTTGDGVFQDRNAIRAAILALNETEGTLFGFPGDLYYCSTDIGIYASNVTLNWRESTITGGGEWEFNGDSGIDNDYSEVRDNCHFLNAHLREEFDHSCPGGVVLAWCSDSTIQNVHRKGTASAGIRLKVCNACTVSNCSVTGGRDAGAGTEIIAVLVWLSNDCIIEDCVLDGDGLPFLYALQIKGGDDNIVRRCTVQNSIDGPTVDSEYCFRDRGDSPFEASASSGATYPFTHPGCGEYDPWLCPDDRRASNRTQFVD